MSLSDSDTHDNPTRIVFTCEDGVRLVADTWGDPSDVPVLFLHGGGQSRHAWGQSASTIAEAGFYGLSLDLRGHGESDWDPEGHYSAPAMAEDLKEIVGALERPPIVVGASMGGLMSLLAEGESTEGILQALVLVDIAPRMEVAGVERIYAFMRARPEGFETLKDAADAISAYLPHRTRQASEEGLRRTLKQNAAGRWTWRWDNRLLDRSAEAFEDDVRRFYDAARRLTLPTLVVRGRMSDVLSEEGVQELLELVPHAQYADVSDAGHMIAGDHNDAFTHVVLTFLQEISASSDPS